MIHFLVLFFQSFLQYRVKITLSLTSIYLESPDALGGGITCKMKLRGVTDEELVPSATSSGTELGQAPVLSPLPHTE